MAFFTFTLPEPGQWFTKQTVQILPNEFQICYDYKQVHQNSLRVLEELCHTGDDLTIAFSGGADSWFLTLCLHQLIREGRIASDRVQIWTGNYTVQGKSLTPYFSEHCQRLESLGLALHTHTQAVEDTDLLKKLCDQFYATASQNPANIAQFCLFDCFPGKVIIAEGGPTVMNPPIFPAGSELALSKLPTETWIMMSALEYERNNRICFHSLDRDLWSSWLIPENVNFYLPNIKKEQYDALTVEQKSFWDGLRYHWRFLIYSAGFPEHSDLFLWKKTSFLDHRGNSRIQDLPELQFWNKKMIYELQYKASKKNINKTIINTDWRGGSGFYSHCWTPIVLK